MLKSWVSPLPPLLIGVLEEEADGDSSRWWGKDRDPACGGGVWLGPHKISCGSSGFFYPKFPERYKDRGLHGLSSGLRPWPHSCLGDDSTNRCVRE